MAQNLSKIYISCCNLHQDDGTDDTTTTYIATNEHFSFQPIHINNDTSIPEFNIDTNEANIITVEPLSPDYREDFGVVKVIRGQNGEPTGMYEIDSSFFGMNKADDYVLSSFEFDVETRPGRNIIEIKVDTDMVRNTYKPQNNLITYQKDYNILFTRNGQTTYVKNIKDANVYVIDDNDDKQYNTQSSTFILYQNRNIPDVNNNQDVGAEIITFSVKSIISLNNDQNAETPFTGIILHNSKEDKTNSLQNIITDISNDNIINISTSNSRTYEQLINELSNIIVGTNDAQGMSYKEVEELYESLKKFMDFIGDGKDEDKKAAAAAVFNSHFKEITDKYGWTDEKGIKRPLTIDDFIHFLKDFYNIVCQRKDTFDSRYYGSLVTLREQRIIYSFRHWNEIVKVQLHGFEYATGLVENNVVTLQQIADTLYLICNGIYIGGSHPPYFNSSDNLGYDLDIRKENNLPPCTLWIPGDYKYLSWDIRDDQGNWKPGQGEKPSLEPCMRRIDQAKDIWVNLEEPVLPYTIVYDEERGNSQS